METSKFYHISFKKFVAQVEKALKPGGFFAITDFRDFDKIEEMEKDLQAFGLVP